MSRLRLPLDPRELLRLGCLFYAPLSGPHGSHPVISQGSITGSTTAADDIAVDTDGTYEHWDTGLVTDAGVNLLRVERRGGVFEATRINVVPVGEYRTFNDVAWASGGGGIAVGGSVTLIDGTTGTANQLTASGANGTLINDLGVIASNEKTVSFDIQRVTGTGDIDVTLDGGSTWTTVAVTTTFTRFQVTQTLADPDIGIRIVTSGDVINVDWAQLESSSGFASSRIPGGGTRSADDLRYDTAGNLVNGGAGTIILAITAGYNISDLAGDSDFMSTFATAPSLSGIQFYFWNAGGAVACDIWNAGGAVAALRPSTDPARDSPQVWSVVWNVNDFRIYANGALEASDTGGAVPTVHATSISVGQDISQTNQFGGNIAHFMTFDRALDGPVIQCISQEILKSL